LTIVSASSPRRARPSLFDAALNAPGVLLGLVVVLFALGLVLALSLRVNDGSTLGGALTTDNFRTAITDPLYARVVLRSLIIAGAVTAATVALAYPIAYYAAFRAGPRRGLVLFLVTLPFWTSYLLRVFAWKIVLAYNGVLNSGLLESGVIRTPILALLDTPAAVVLTLAHAYAAFAILPIFVALDRIPRNLQEAAADLGARPTRTFGRVILPLSMPGVLSAALVVFVPTVGDYVTPALVGGPDSIMIGSIIAAQFGKANDWPFGAAVSVLTILIILAVMLAVRWLDRRFGSGT
jgi:spermidine/putrescine transport system permease protein